MKTIKSLILLAIVMTGCVTASKTTDQVPSQPVVRTTPLPLIPSPTGNNLTFPESVLSANRQEMPVNSTRFQLEIFAEGFIVPWSMVFTSSNRILISERNGHIREVVDGQLNPQPLISFTSVSVQGEAGLLGLALDPAYSSNRFLYAIYTTSKDGLLINRVVKLSDLGSSLEQIGIILDDLPAARNHAGGRLRFGEDGKLYISVGDAQQPALSQDVNSLAGKILRINTDGTIPADNPFPDSLVYSLGHRNAQGMDWDPTNNLFYATEHGPSGFDGAPGGDEINLIQAGGNYGWPLISHVEIETGLTQPLVQFSPAVAPGSGMFYTGALFPQFNGNFFFGGLVGEGLYRVVLSTNNPTEILLIDKLDIAVGRIRDVVQGPDGAIYFTTSNSDGRGRMREGDDKIYRLSPLP